MKLVVLIPHFPSTLWSIPLSLSNIAEEIEVLRSAFMYSYVSHVIIYFWTLHLFFACNVGRWVIFMVNCLSLVYCPFLFSFWDLGSLRMVSYLMSCFHVNRVFEIINVRSETFTNYALTGDYYFRKEIMEYDDWV